MSRVEDTGEINPKEIPVLVYRTELHPFNEKDDRAFPERGDVAADKKERGTALYKDAVGIQEYLGKFASMLGYDVVNHPTSSALWLALDDLVEHMGRCRSEVDTDERTTRKFPLEGRTYLSREWTLAEKAHGRLGANLAVMEALYPKVTLMASQVNMVLENHVYDLEDSEEVAGKVEAFRVSEYDTIRKRLVDLRYRERAARKKGY